MKRGKDIGKNYIWQSCIEITNMLLPLVTSPILARRLGAESLGVYSYIYTLTYYFIQIAYVGMYQYGTREIAIVRDCKELLNKRFSELFFFQLLHGGFVLFVFFSLSAIAFPKYLELLLINSIYLVGVILLINFYYAGIENFKPISIMTMLTRGLGVAFIIAFVKTKEDLPVYVLIIAMEPFINSLALLWLTRKRVQLVRVRIGEVLSHFKGLYSILIPIVAISLYATMDRVMLGNLSDISQLGYYSNAEKALIAKNLAVSLSVVLMPRMSRLIENNDENTYTNLMNTSVELILLLTYAFAFGTAAISSVFSIVFWGEDFAACGNLIRVMSFTLPAYGLTFIINNQFLVPKKMENVYIWSTLLGAFVNLVLNYMLIPTYAAFGAALATLITQFIVLLCECYVIKRDYSILKAIKRTLPYLLFGLIMYVILVTVDNCLAYNIFTLIIEVIMGMFVFLALCILYWIYFDRRMYLSIIKGLIG